MTLASRIAAIDLEIAEVQEERIGLDARLRGLEENRRVLQGHATPAAGLAELMRTDAIMEVLRECREALGVKDIKAAFSAAGRTGDDPASIGATLTYLLAQKMVERPTRGRYRAVA
jgi:hypothetical protein